MRLARGIITIMLFWAAWCDTLWAAVTVPEIDPACASSAVGFIVCALLILLDRWTKSCKVMPAPSVGDDAASSVITGDCVGTGAKSGQAE